MEIGKLRANDGQKYVTWKNAKTQIRELAKERGLELETFRPRSVNKNVLEVPLKDGAGVITAQRKPDALITVVQQLDAEDISPELMEEIVSQSKWNPEAL